MIFSFSVPVKCFNSLTYFITVKIDIQEHTQNKIIFWMQELNLKITLNIYNQRLSWYLESRLSASLKDVPAGHLETALTSGLSANMAVFVSTVYCCFSHRKWSGMKLPLPCTVVCWTLMQLLCFLLTWLFSFYDLFVSCFLNWVVGFPVLRNMMHCFRQWLNFPSTIYKAVKYFSQI